MHKKEVHHHHKDIHPVFKQKLTFGQRAADSITHFGGSWTFIIIFGLVFMVWVGINTWALTTNYHFDTFPFILLNLALSCLAAVQAPIILMSQNRENERDRIHAHYDYSVNRKAEREIQILQRDIAEIKELLKKK
jgi:uncharacterized membrane protein